MKYESGKMYGVYRCKKRGSIINKVPSIEKKELPDVTGIILSGIMNFGNDADSIKNMAAYAIGCNPEDVKIRYDELSIAKSKFIKSVIIGKLTGSLSYSVDSLVETFYEFVDTPTETTKKLQAKSDARDINRYLTCEVRHPIVIGQPYVNICGAGFECQLDYIFCGKQKIRTNKHKEGRKYIYDEAEAEMVEAVKLFPGKPQVKETSKVLDTGLSTRLEMYVMIKALEKWCEENNKKDVVLRASYYYLQKERETDDNYISQFFGKGGNVVSMTVLPENFTKLDAMFEPQIKEFIDGIDVQPDICKNCASRAICEYYDSAVPLTDEQKIKPKTLPVLSKAQEEAANALEGNIRVIATAGSGKTTAMAYRIMNLLKAGVMPEKIGCFTFTNAGAGEMSDRIKGFCEIAGINADVDKITISTIHSFGDSLLKKYYNLLGYKKPPVLINEIQKTKIIETILSENEPIGELIDKYKNFYLDMFKAKGILELMKGYFSSIMEGLSQDEFKNFSGLGDDAVNAIYRMYMQYASYKKDACLIEHSDQELGILRLLNIKPDLFDEIGIEHISVDEYQDTSNTQFKIINAMRQAKGVKSLFIVGDDDQSIYGFRDANVHLIKDFFDMIGEEGKDIKLMENRRSTCQIVDFASCLISNNEGRIQKNPVSVNEAGNPVNVLAFEDKDKEQQFIVDKIEEMIKSGVKDSDIAILAPTNNELLVYADMLKKKGIQSISINPEPILDNPRVKGAIAFVKFLSDNNEFNGMCYINARDKGNVVDKTDKEIKNAIVALQEEAKSVTNVTQLFEKFTALDPEENDEIYQSFLDDIKTAEDDAVQRENLGKVCEYIIDFDRFGRKQTARKEKTYNGVVLSTMHSSKGKEWPIVFCSVSKLHGRDLNPDDIPEKNRLLFVACTRAKKELYVTGVSIAFSSARAGDVGNMFLEECIEAKNNIQQNNAA